jgi:hypothetical protein
MRKQKENNTGGAGDQECDCNTLGSEAFCFYVDLFIHIYIADTPYIYIPYFSGDNAQLVYNAHDAN